MYIYSICYNFCIFGLLSYGNPMGMVWESYGADRRIIIAYSIRKGSCRLRGRRYGRRQ